MQRVPRIELRALGTMVRRSPKLPCGLQSAVALQHAVRFMGFLSDHQIPPNRVSFVIGKYGQSKALGLKDVESALGSRILTTIPEDAASANEATNSGKPVLLGRPNSGLSKAIKLVTDKLTQATRQV